MLPSQQLPYSASTSQSSLSSYTLPSIQSFPSVGAYGSQQPFLPHSLQEQHSLHPGSDPNSPEIFKQSIQVVQEHVGRVQALARSVLSGIDNAYQPGNTPAQTEADIATLKQTLNLLADIMRHTGVGALPLVPLPASSTSSPPVAPTEQQMMTDTTRAIQVMFERLKRSQESAQVVASLLSAPVGR